MKNNAYKIAKEIKDRSKNMSEKDGESIIQILLDGRSSEELEENELYLLSTGYNWAMKESEALESSTLLVKRAPNNTDYLHEHWDYMWNCYCSNMPLLLDEAKQNIKTKLGPPSFWYLYMAQEAIDLAYEEDSEQDFEWHEDRPVLKQEWLDKAAAYLTKAIAITPELIEGPHPYDIEDCTWEVRFEGLLYHQKYHNLNRQKSF